VEVMGAAGVEVAGRGREGRGAAGAGLQAGGGIGLGVRPPGDALPRCSFSCGSSS